MGEIANSAENTIENFEGFPPQPVHCRWLSDSDKARAPHAEIVRLIVDEGRGMVDPPWPNEIYNRNLLEPISQQSIECDEGAGERDEPVEALDAPLEAGDGPPVAVEPGEGAFDLPAALVPAQLAAVVGRFLGAVLAVRGNEVDAPLGERFAEFVGVVGAVGDQRDFVGDGDRLGDARQGRFEEVDFGDAGRVGEAGQGDALSVGDDLDFGADPTFRRADADPPFRASAKVASAKSSEVSSRPASWSSSKTMAWTRGQRPNLVQRAKRRQQVTPAGNSALGIAFQRRPLRSKWTMPAKQRLSSAKGRPPLGWGRLGGKSGATRSHMASVSSASRAGLGMGGPPCAIRIMPKTPRTCQPRLRNRF